MPAIAQAFMTAFLIRGDNRGSFADSLVQEGIELGPDLILLRAGDMAIRAFVLRFCLGGRGLWLMMIEIVEPPPTGIGVALGILDGHIRAVKRPGKIALPRK